MLMIYVQTQKLDLLDKPIVGVDPGKNDLYTGCTIVQDNPLFFSYSSKETKIKRIIL